MSGHTPGPWVLDPCHDGWQLLVSGRNVTAEPFDCSDEDARLIASAPELLAALKGVAAAHACIESCDMPEWLDAVESAIAKAEGRSE